MYDCAPSLRACEPSLRACDTQGLNKSQQEKKLITVWRETLAEGKFGESLKELLLAK